VGLRAYRLATEPAPPDAPAQELDKDFAGDPEIARLYRETQDYEKIRAVVAQVAARKERVEQILAEGELVPAFLAYFAELHTRVWLETITIGASRITLSCGAPASEDGVALMKQLEAAPSVAGVALESDREITTSTTGRPSRLVTISAGLSP
jgi:hypothetical protein